ncbi:hypothetical protein [Neptuniibacter sp. CAU 1671]|uniref:hypothetical protein n=1 Tax=Neptuniibacter sp. CAU 1671 TaxID=3032593 RepID=UPI0023DAAE74|nr:hypothetical protein [Neptuniibacter sp. CAU 1671]MDF2181689.1 hypothetical protein [Neptuniibacter sp. CAU 1671]
MNKETLHRHLIQLLNNGYSEDEIRSLVIAPHALIDQVIAEFRQQQQTITRQQRSQQSQAAFAMRLKH